MIVNPRRGMTLIELLVAMAIGSMIVASVFAVLASANRTQNLGEKRTDLFQSVRVSLDQMTTDLQLAVTRENDEQFTFVGTDETQDGVPMDMLEFTSISGEPLSSVLPTSELLRIQYYVDVDDQTRQIGLTRSAIPLPLPDSIPEAEQDLSARTYCPWAMGLNIAYFDPQQQDWVEEWQDRTDLPTAVRIVLYVLPEATDEAVNVDLTTLIPFSTVAQLTLAQTALGTGQPTSGEQTSGGAAGAAMGSAPGESQLPGLPGGSNIPGLPSELLPGGGGEQ